MNNGITTLRRRKRMKFSLSNMEDHMYIKDEPQTQNSNDEIFFKCSHKDKGRSESLSGIEVTTGLVEQDFSFHTIKNEPTCEDHNFESITIKEEPLDYGCIEYPMISNDPLCSNLKLPDPNVCDSESTLSAYTSDDDTPNRISNHQKCVIDLKNLHKNQESSVDSQNIHDSCDICGVSFSSNGQWLTHMYSEEHNKMFLNLKNGLDEIENEITSENALYDQNILLGNEASVTGSVPYVPLELFNRRIILYGDVKGLNRPTFKSKSSNKNVTNAQKRDTELPIILMPYNVQVCSPSNKPKLIQMFLPHVDQMTSDNLVKQWLSIPQNSSIGKCSDKLADKFNVRFNNPYNEPNPEVSINNIGADSKSPIINAKNAYLKEQIEQKNCKFRSKVITKSENAKVNFWLDTAYKNLNLGKPSAKGTKNVEEDTESSAHSEESFLKQLGLVGVQKGRENHSEKPNVSFNPYVSSLLCLHSQVTNEKHLQTPRKYKKRLKRRNSLELKIPPKKSKMSLLSFKSNDKIKNKNNEMKIPAKPQKDKDFASAVKKLLKNSKVGYNTRTKFRQGKNRKAIKEHIKNKICTPSIIKNKLKHSKAFSNVLYRSKSSIVLKTNNITKNKFSANLRLPKNSTKKSLNPEYSILTSKMYPKVELHKIDLQNQTFYKEGAKEPSANKTFVKESKNQLSAGKKLDKENENEHSAKKICPPQKKCMSINIYANTKDNSEVIHATNRICSEDIETQDTSNKILTDNIKTQHTQNKTLVKDVELTPNKTLVKDVEHTPNKTLVKDVEHTPNKTLVKDVEHTPNKTLVKDVEHTPNKRLVKDVEHTPNKTLVKDVEHTPNKTLVKDVEHEHSAIKIFNNKNEYKQIIALENDKHVQICHTDDVDDKVLSSTDNIQYQKNFFVDESDIQCEEISVNDQICEQYSSDIYGSSENLKEFNIKDAEYSALLDFS